MEENLSGRSRIRFTNLGTPIRWLRLRDRRLAIPRQMATKGPADPFWRDTIRSIILQSISPRKSIQRRQGKVLSLRPIRRCRFQDAPANPCLPGGTQCYTTPATSGDLEFVDNLAGIVPCTTPGIGNCGVDSLANSEPIPFQYKGATVSGLVWTDTFNGIVDPNTGNGGIAALSNLFPVDGGSGTGGITILIGGAVPEPSTWVMIVFGFAGLGVAGHRRVKPRSVTAPTAA